MAKRKTDDKVIATPDVPVAEAASSSEGIIALSETENPKAYWYVVHTYSGHESKVAVTLQQRVESLGLGAKITHLLVPTQGKIVISEGRKKNVSERLFPGYILVKMELDDDTWQVVRNTTGVTGFVGAGSVPTALSEDEVISIMRFTKMEAPTFEATYEVGDAVKIIDGPFADFLGKVDSLDKEKGKVRVLVSIFGRETPVELDLIQVTSL